MPSIVLAEACSWYSVLTTSNIGHVIEESIWGWAALMLVASLATVWPLCSRRRRHWLALWCAAGVIYVAFMFMVDVPMYWSRWLADEASGRVYLTLAQGVIDASSRWVVSSRWEVWKTEVVWMSLYFSVAVWISIALAATLLGSVTIARLINRPLKQLSFAASRIREGDLDSRLDENTLTSEIREVNMGFNRMARELARVEEDRAVMLAGISHDLRTPLARLRLETEMSVNDEEAKRNMAMDIDQLDAIIDKFMDYARPGETTMRAVHISQLIDREASGFRDPSQIRITSRVAIDLKVMADDVELGRVFANLFENARRYGRGTNTGIADVQVSYARTGPWVIVTVRDHGPGVAPEKLGELTTPFFRGDAARTAATGAGLGLAIVDKAMQRMGGSLELANAPDGGLMAHIRLKRAP